MTEQAVFSCRKCIHYEVESGEPCESCYPVQIPVDIPDQWRPREEESGEAYAQMRAYMFGKVTASNSDEKPSGRKLSDALGEIRDLGLHIEFLEKRYADLRRGYVMLCTALRWVWRHGRCCMEELPPELHEEVRSALGPGME